MAKLSSDGKSVTVEKGDTLSKIAEEYCGVASKTKQLAAINNISNVNRIYVGQVIKLEKSSSSSSTTKKVNTNTATITHFGLQSNTDATLFATWTWGKPNVEVENYEIRWQYHTGDGVWFIGSNSTTTDKQSTYNYPSNATAVRFRVKPVSKKKKDSNGKEKGAYWTADWSSWKQYNVSSRPLGVPSAPNVEITKYKLVTEISNVDIESLNATNIQFQIIKNNTTIFKTGNAGINVGLKYVSYSCTIDAGAEYKVRCRAYKNKIYGDWSDYSSVAGTPPAASAGIIALKALSKTEVQLDWENVSNATKYKVEYTTKKRYFDSNSSEVNSVEVDAKVAGHAEITGLESGQEYFFRVRAENEHGESAWTAIKSITLGSKPDAPTTWSSTTTVITGEPLTLYWVHNSKDESSQTMAQVEVTVGEVKNTYAVTNPYIDDEDSKDKTLSYSIDTSSYTEGTTIEWRVRTAGVTKEYGEWSILRTVNIYAPPTLELDVSDIDGNSVETLTSFPFYISGLAGPSTQMPIGYHVSIVSNMSYETTDNIGNPIVVSADEQIYSKYFDISEPLLIEMSAGNIDLQTGITYTVVCVASMNSGLTAESSVEFTVDWTDKSYTPNIEIYLDEDTLSTHIKPYCEEITLTIHEVEKNGDVYTITDKTIDAVYGEEIQNGFTTTGEQVYYGTTDEGAEVYYCTVETSVLVDDVSLSLYRREFDGSFTELATGIENLKHTTVTDPHPSLDFARYRIVARDDDTGAISYYDPPGYAVDCKAIIIQWDEQWSNFETTEDADLAQPAWSGSLLKFPYNIDIRDDHNPDVAYINYIGRKRPVSYYGTQLGETATWDFEIVKSDKDTLYALRRLAIYNGDVYIREPSGSGYWASVTVSFSQTHKELTIPVTLDITRVEGGI